VCSQSSVMRHCSCWRVGLGRCCDVGAKQFWFLNRMWLLS